MGDAAKTLVRPGPGGYPKSARSCPNLHLQSPVLSEPTPAPTNYDTAKTAQIPARPSKRHAALAGDTSARRHDLMGRRCLHRLHLKGIENPQLRDDAIFEPRASHELNKLLCGPRRLTVATGCTAPCSHVLACARMCSHVLACARMCSHVLAEPRSSS